MYIKIYITIVYANGFCINDEIIVKDYSHGYTYEYCYTLDDGDSIPKVAIWSIEQKYGKKSNPKITKCAIFPFHMLEYNP